MSSSKHVPTDNTIIQLELSINAIIILGSLQKRKEKKKNEKKRAHLK